MPLKRVSPIKYWLIMVFFCFHGLIFGQEISLPKVIKPSPETSSLFRFQDYPMDKSVGLPQISIPIYEVVSGSLSVPVSISYHASGCRVYEQDGPIAANWGLSAGGAISRIIYGSTDFGDGHGTYKFPFPFKTAGLSKENDLKYLEKIAHYDNISAQILPWAESEYDIFSYSLNNMSGKFIFKDNNGVKTPALLPYKPYIVKPYYGEFGLNKIEITDDKGVFYSFGGTETYGNSSSGAVSTLSLNTIISADKSDTITFKYDAFTQERLTFSQQWILIDDWSMNPEPWPATYPEQSEVTNRDTYQNARLKEIIFKQGKIKFNLLQNDDKIDNIQIVNLKNEAIKTVEFKRSSLHKFLDGVKPTNKLDKLIFKDKTGKAIENYSFEYYPTKYATANPAINVRHCDWWGYYNASGKSNMMPDYKGVYYVGSGGYAPIDLGNGDFNREPDLDALKSGVLKTITFPGLGTMEIAYENNKYFNNLAGSVKDGPGLRVSQIKTDDKRGTTRLKTYKYGTNESGYGFIELLPQMNTMATEVNHAFFSDPELNPERSGHYRQRTFYSGFITELSAISERPVVYPEVAEYNGTPSGNVGKKVSMYDWTQWAPSGMPAFGFQVIPKMHIYNWNYWDNPSLVVEKDYKMVTNGSSIAYKKKKEVINSYTNTIIEDVAGLHVQRLLNLPQTGYLGFLGKRYYVEEYSTHISSPSADIYTFSDYHIPVGVKNLTATIETVFNDADSIKNSVTYNYNSRQFISETTRHDSNNNVLKTQIKYPFDYAGDAVLTKMSGTELNMLNFPVEQNELKNSTPLKSIKTDYYNVNEGSTNPAMIAPLTIRTRNGTNPYETRIHYFGYDKDGNPTSFSRENDVRSAYIWGYKNEYPIAEVINAEPKDIFHTSFEDDKEGGLAGESKTGKRYFNGNYTKALTNLTNGEYLLTYWQKSDNWELKTLNVTVSNQSYTININDIIDELCFHPKISKIITNTFDPLIGKTSETGPNHITRYYTYDDFGRLKAIKDQKGNIIKTIDYNYIITAPSTTSN